VLAIVVTAAWTAVWTWLLVKFCEKCFGSIRVSAYEEDIGLDWVDHGEVMLSSWCHVHGLHLIVEVSCVSHIRSHIMICMYESLPTVATVKFAAAVRRFSIVLLKGCCSCEGVQTCLLSVAATVTPQTPKASDPSVVSPLLAEGYPINSVASTGGESDNDSLEDLPLWNQP
jgi:hypothetical protein